MVKVISLFLIAMLVLGMFGKLRMPRVSRKAATCPACGRPKIGRGPCACGKTG